MIDKIADYLYDKIEFLHDWDRDRFVDMMYWYAANGLLFAIKGKDDEIVGASAVRITNKDDEYARDEHYNHDPEGDTYYIEFMASDEKYARMRMLDMAIEKLGVKKWVQYEKFKDCNRLVTLPANRFKQIHQIG